jgi:hypothetical protein
LAAGTRPHAPEAVIKEGTGVERWVAAFPVMDVARYSRLMGADEEALLWR